jgi:DNA-binding transcriptional regulator YiaG
MTLNEWLSKNKVRPEIFADSIRVSRGAVLKWMSGERFPRKGALAKISRVTNGQVTANDFLLGGK